MALLLLCAILYLPGLTTIPPIDRDEAYFAQSTRQMLETGDFVRPRFQGRDRYRKPIGIYWLQAAAVAALGRRDFRTIWAYRIPSVVGATLAVLTTYSIGKALFDSETALLAGAILASSILLMLQALIAKTDAMLLACVVAAQWPLSVVYLRPQTQRAPARYAALFWTAQGLAILIKGPVAPLVSLLTVVALATMHWFDATTTPRSVLRNLLRDLRLAWGIPLAIIIVAPWTVAIGFSSNWSFFGRAIAHDLVPKVVAGVESHGGWPGYYLLTAMVTFWPASIVAGVAVWQTLGSREGTAARFVLAWLIPNWLFFELVPTKLPHYVLPVFPALALATARFAVVAEPTARCLRWIRLEGALWLTATILFGASLIVAPQFLGGRESTFAFIGSIVVLASGWVAFRAGWRGDLRRGLWCSVLCAVGLTFVLRFWIVPGLDPLWLPSRAAAAIAAKRGSDSVPLAVVGYEEPSLVFLFGTDTLFTNPAAAAQLLKDRAGTIVLVNDRQRGDFESALRSKAIAAAPFWRGSGIDYTKGRAVSVTAFRLAPTSK
jgi:4-amino-4-deoxy-L-arabinose transferase-like glycosyltransferase